MEGKRRRQKATTALQKQTTYRATDSPAAWIRIRMSGSPDKVRGRIPIGMRRDVCQEVEASRRREIAAGAVLG